METDVLEIRLGVPKRKRLKADAVPTIFPEPTRPRSAEVQSTSFTEASASDVERMESASDAGECFSLQQSMSSAGPENVLVLDGLPLEPFVPYQIVSQYGFHYTLVPHKPESVAERVQDKQTQTAIPTSTLGNIVISFTGNRPFTHVAYYQFGLQALKLGSTCKVGKARQA
ncbi:uncharacterized protein LOC135395807 [Ornithodoros turicata]|uniref:uncharacterized protein LOC135395807 n=1 Tax=Ornithodoros turicata TaxID=34597 RepID=UPI003139A454